jgi:glycerol-3-phosphate dehydrogenase
VSIAGGKLTTFRRMAERVVDLTCERLQETGQTLPKRIGESAAVGLSGGDTGDDVEAYGARLKGRWPRVAPDIVDRLVRVYGSNAERMVEAMSADPALAERCGLDGAVTRAEVEYAVRDEMALTLTDFLERRGRVFLWEPDNGDAVAEGVARTMGAMLRWTPARITDEVAAYRAHVRQVKSFQQAAEFPAETVQAVHA